MFDRATKRHQAQKELPKLGLFEKPLAAFTLVQVTMCLAVTGIIFAGILAGYVQSTRNTERSEHALAVLGLASNHPEQTRAARRETLDAPVLNEVMQLPSVAWANPVRPSSGVD